MKHWNFFPCLFLLLALFWYRFVDLRVEELKINGQNKEKTIEVPPINSIFNLDLPPLVLPHSGGVEKFDPLGPNSAENSEIEKKNSI
jgi:hypothetical protein